MLINSNYNAHAKCELKLPPNCSKLKRVYKPKTHNVAVTKSVTHSYPGPNPSSEKGTLIPRRLTLVERSTRTESPEILEEDSTFIGTNLNQAPSEIAAPAVVENDEADPKSSINNTTLLSISAGSPAIVLYNYTAAEETEATVREGEKVLVVKSDNAGWTVIAKHHTTGAVPTSYLQPLIPNVGSNTTISEEPVKTVNLELI